MNQASKFIPCCFFHFLMCSRIIKYIYFIPNFAVPFWGLMDIMLILRYFYLSYYDEQKKKRIEEFSIRFAKICLS